MNEQLAISIIKEDKDQNKIQDAINFLVDTHSGIYYNMAKSYIGQSPDFGYSQDDAKDEMPYMFWEAAKEYDDTKGCKFSSFIGEKASWHFRKQNKRRGRYVNVSYDEGDFWETYQKENGIFDSICESATDKICREELVKSIMECISSIENPTAKRIMELRYLTGKGNKTMPFAEIAEQVGYSMMNVILIHSAEIEKIQRSLKKQKIS